MDYENLKPKNANLLDRILNAIEKTGNKMPDSITLFLLLSFFLLILSAIGSVFHWNAIHPGTGETMTVLNLFSKEGFRMIWGKAISNFTSFPPFGMVLVAVIGSSVAEKSGFLTSLMRKTILGIPHSMVTFTLIFVSINANMIGDAGFILIPPLAATIYLSIGRSPILGLLIAFACISAGFSANLSIGLLDVTTYSYTESAAKLMDPNYLASPAINWLFLFISCFLLSLLGTVLVEKVLVKRYPVTKKQLSDWSEGVSIENLTPVQNKALLLAGISALLYVIIVVLLCLGDDPFFGDPNVLSNKLLSAESPMMKGIIPTITLLFLIPSVVYGIVCGKYRSDKDIYQDIIEGFKEMAQYIFLCFFIAQFINYFSWSNIGPILAIKGSNFLNSLHFTGIPLLLGLMFISSLLNLIIGSASSKWAILAPIFIPMMMIIGFDPAVTQLVYRIGDSLSNPLSPLSPYFPVLIGFAKKYDKNAGIGTMIAKVIPFSVVFTIIWIIQLFIWIVFNLPLGPGGGIYLP
ncbi:aminobenzoyl-glutamate transporter [Clostridia bacterium]|nr:aminobenzoyl-glutamate transporter [Clostridia bacterium]